MTVSRSSPKEGDILLQQAYESPGRLTKQSHLTETNLPSHYATAVDASPRSRSLSNSTRDLSMENEELSTVFNGNKAQFGAMFDVRSLPNNSVLVDSLAFHTLDILEECQVQIFTKIGSHEYFEEQSSVWKRILSTTTDCKGPGRKTVVNIGQGYIDDLEDVRIGRSERRAFFIRLVDTQLIYSVVQDMNVVFKGDEHIQIFTGTAVGGYFKDFWSPRMANVALTYIVEQKWNGNIGLGGGAAPQFGEAISDDVCTDTLNIRTSDTTSKNYGLMFDVTRNSEEEITVYGLGFFIDSSVSMLSYDMYSLADGFQHGSATMSLWTHIAQGTIAQASAGDEIMVAGKDFAPVTLEVGKKHGFFIALQSELLRYHFTNVQLGDTYHHNGDIAVSVGVGVNSYTLDENTKFYPRRAYHGTIIYGKNKVCEPEITVKYSFLVEYQVEYSANTVYEFMNKNIKDTITSFIHNDASLNRLKNELDLDFSSIYSALAESPVSNCGPVTKTNIGCQPIDTEVTLTYYGSLDVGDVKYTLLSHAGVVVDNLNTNSPLDVQYNGEVPLDTSLVISLSGVPSKDMSDEELTYFQETTRDFLKQKEVGTLKILSIEVSGQTLHLGRRSLQAETQFARSGIRRIQESSSSIDIATKVNAKHRPPSPGLDFDELVEDSINSADGSYREELLKGGMGESDSGASYFSNVNEVRAMPVPDVPPPAAPTLQYQPKEAKGGITVPISIAIIVGAALLTFALVFGAFVYRKRKQDRKRYNSKSIFDDEDDEDDPLFFDSFMDKKDINNITTIPTRNLFKSQRSQKSHGSSSTEDVTEDTRDRHRSLGERYPSRSSQRSGSNRSIEDAIDHGNNRYYEPSGPMVRKDRMTKESSSRSFGERPGLGEKSGSWRNNNGDRPGLGPRNYGNESARWSNSNNIDRPGLGPKDYSANRSGLRSTRDYDDDYEERINRKESYQPYAMERSQSRRSAMDDHEERIRQKYTGGRSGGSASRDNYEGHQSSRSFEHHSSSRDNYEGHQSSRSFEHHSSSRDNYEGHQSSRSFEHHSSSNNFKREESSHNLVRQQVRNDDWDLQESNMPPAHLRFQRRPSEDGDGISIASASTNSTLSTKISNFRP